MSTMTNNSLHTASLTNNEIMQQTKNTTWDLATFTWDQAQGTWNNPFAIQNNSLHTATMTNRSANQ